jgi:peptide chain release factor subunit 1
MDVMKEKDLKAMIKELEKIRGRHTELVTVYVPAGFSLSKVADQIRSEQSTAQNIKSKAVRKNVMASLEKLMQHLKLYKETPPNGLVIFCGNVSDKEGVDDIELWAIEPHEPIKTRLYRCDQEFILDPLRDMVREKEIYGIVVVDKSNAAIGVLKGKKVQMLKNLDSIVPGKTKAGGWSANRYARIREGLLHDFLKKVGEVATANFKQMPEIIGVIIAGPGPIKEEFAEGDFLEYTIKGKILGIVNTSYTGEYGLREAVERSEDLISEASVIREKRVLDRFFTELEKDSGLGVYGFFETAKALKAGNIETLLISDAFDWVRTGFECPSCGYKAEKIIDRKQIDEQKCPECNSRMGVTMEKEITENIIRTAEEMGTKVEMISTDTQRGEQLKELGGIAGILRFRSQG